MKNKFLTLVLAATVVAFSSGCFTMRHTVGNGGSGATETTERQWFALWGLIPLGDVDGGEMAGNAQDYTIQTQWSVIDIVINIFTSFVSVYSQTVTVTR